MKIFVAFAVAPFVRKCCQVLVECKVGVVPARQNSLRRLNFYVGLAYVVTVSVCM